MSTRAESLPVTDGNGVVDESLSAPARTLLFGPLAPTDVSSAVVHRLRAAIGLGLLPDGKRLPKESDLAAQMGITTFALREALAELRSQGLLVTRAGKYGGSFVTHPVDSEDLEREELVALSSAELRDLGDWRQMLAAHAAALAAQRASQSSASTLLDYAERVRVATTASQARRAHGRFHLELTSAAQSMRMTRAEFVVHEQIDWLFGLVLRTDEERERSAALLTELAVAVRDHDAPAARGASERHIAHLVDGLAQLRLEMIAAQKPTVNKRGSTLGAEIAKVVSTFVTQLSAYAEAVAPVLADVHSYQAVSAQVSLAGLQHFEALPPFVRGVGTVAEVGVVPAHPYWISYWLRTDDGPVADVQHVLDPDREDFYDYEHMDFVSTPRESRKPCAIGPYVDYGGVDDYILTIDAPIVRDGRFLGVCVADVLVADLESWLAPWLATAEESYLINAERRVIVSNSVRYRVGDIVASLDEGRRRDYPVLGWSLVTST